MGRFDDRDSEIAQDDGGAAERLGRFWRADDPRFDLLLDELLEANRQSVIDEAAAALDQTEQIAFMDDVNVLAEMVLRVNRDGERVATSLYWIAAEVEGDAAEPPPVRAVEDALSTAELIDDADEVRLLPLWLDPEKLAYLEAGDRRALLRQLAASPDQARRYVRKEELTADPGTGSDTRLLAMVALLDEPSDEESPVHRGDAWEEEDEEAVSEERAAAALAEFSAEVAEADPRVLRCRPVGSLAGLLEFAAEESWDDTSSLDELSNFIDRALQEAENGEVHALLRRAPGTLGVVLSGSEGQPLDADSFMLSEEQVKDAVALLKRRCRVVRLPES